MNIKKCPKEYLGIGELAEYFNVGVCSGCTNEAARRAKAKECWGALEPLLASKYHYYQNAADTGFVLDLHSRKTPMDKNIALEKQKRIQHICSIAEKLR